MRFQKLAMKAVHGAIQLGRKVKKEDLQKLGNKAIHTAKAIESGLTADNIQKYSDKAKDIGARVTDTAGRAADVAEKVGNVANAVGLSKIGGHAHTFSKHARSVHEKGKEAGKVLGYTQI